MEDILNLKNGITKATIRYLLTYITGHQININKLLKKLRVGGTQRNIEIQRAKLLKELKEVGKKFNIELIKITKKIVIIQLNITGYLKSNFTTQQEISENILWYFWGVWYIFLI
ncbi:MULTISPECIES: hypothetical protein [unclassified Nitratiruptor]|uniref:hypothetical protein n=1 Tax=unclassified Nitratiruptor TaxID=2624044 RepID=UPI0019169F88|nr:MULTISPECIES: hypothetical protein [unclassified Nitratiruptor]